MNHTPPPYVPIPGMSNEEAPFQTLILTTEFKLLHHSVYHWLLNSLPKTYNTEMMKVVLLHWSDSLGIFKY